jgi:hypothetical protein
MAMTTRTDDHVLYEGPVEPDRDGDPQPLAELAEDDNPLELAGEELPDEEDVP